MPKQTTKYQLLNDIATERRRLEKHLSPLKAEEMIQPEVCGTWSVKDILAHLAAWESLFLEWYQAGVQGILTTTLPVGMGQKSIAALNQQIYDLNQHRSLEAVLSEFHSSYQQILSVIEDIPEEDIFAYGRFAWTGKLTLADYIAGNTCNHYAWAKVQIRKWAKGKQSENN